MTKQGSHWDHFPAFLILNVVASGFNTSWSRSSAPRPGGSGPWIRISSRGNGHVIYCCWRRATGARARGVGEDKMTETEKSRIALWNHSELLAPHSGMGSAVPALGHREVTLYFENTLGWQLNINGRIIL